MSRLVSALAGGAGSLGIDLTKFQKEQFVQFAAELNKWNSKINLTTIESDDDVALKHFVDSIVPLKYLSECKALLDIGSGGGFPSIPLRICSEIDEIVSVDAVEKKINFQRHVARKLQLQGFKALHLRGEDLVKEYTEYFDFVISRAFSDIPNFVKLAKPLLREGGCIIAMKGKYGGEEAAAAAAELSKLGLEIENIEEYKLPIAGDSRSLLIFRKVV